MRPFVRIGMVLGAIAAGGGSIGCIDQARCDAGVERARSEAAERQVQAAFRQWNQSMAEMSARDAAARAELYGKLRELGAQNLLLGERLARAEQALADERAGGSSRGETASISPWAALHAPSRRLDPVVPWDLRPKAPPAVKPPVFQFLERGGKAPRRTLDESNPWAIAASAPADEPPGLRRIHPPPERTLDETVPYN